MRLTLRDAASYLGVEEPTVRRWMRERALPVHRFAERFYLNAIELWEWAAQNRIPVSRALLEQAGAAEDDVPSLEDLLRAGGIHHDVPGRDKSEVLREVVSRLPLPPEYDRTFLLTVLEAREKLGSTGIGAGIAIPHVRSPIIIHVTQPLLTACLLRAPIEFGASDHQPVHTVFTLVSPSVPSHLRALAQLSFALRDETLREMLWDGAETDDLLGRVHMVEQRTTSWYRAITDEHG